MSEWREIVGIIERVQREIADLSIRGLRVIGPQHLANLKGLRDELARVNAAYLAEQIGSLVDAIRIDDGSAAAKLMYAQTTLRLFERILTQETVAGALEQLVAVEEGDGA